MILSQLTLLSLVQEPAKNLPKLPDSPFFWVPPDASVTVQNVDGVWNFLLWVSLVSTVAIVGAIAYFCSKYKAPSRKANVVVEKSSDHNTALEVTWSIIPLFIVVGIFVAGFRGYVDLRTPPQGAMEIRAVGQKWKWSFEYPGGFSDDTLHVPIDRPVRIVINSVDVLHSLFIPAFRTKMDAVPGRYTDLWFRATQVGEFPIFCAEYCGTSHSDMLSVVVVHPKGGYEQWLQTQQDQAQKLPPAELGKVLYQKKGCETCHSVDGTAKIGPTWKGVFGRTASFVDGSSSKADENYLRESILNPQAKIVQGFAPAMPTYQGQLKDNEINALIEYMKTLK